ncbi:chromatin-binding transcription regulator ADA2 [Spizellomyces punctatus DAOM BR117]|uniref:Transcriptional adapter 2 n=1 Tax=Spizellomyces punctatus (strain DAOM BR117) TaxID=645134 RepID=A0A0L0HFL5_SPIPD|nr:chromatin-binding transcription regulator ADA2 [Spizellomyces punctatus DAOM BR117]KNC99897.1 hypothetical protein SPPG_05269 [Spizellomyces punctatus DAOM BR117]|eukprot:XP_016607937.1 hypothetical protein SPPG_05269 [Spizellomyces punctatus DAOM BR117]
MRTLGEDRDKGTEEDSVARQVEKEFGQQFHCDACTKDISNLVRIRCAECPDFDLCVACFGHGAEPPGSSHLANHSYRVMEMLDFPIFEADWGADEELKLVTAIEQYGLGNWEQVAEQIGTKNRRECAGHYERVYLKSDTFPIPNMSVQLDHTKRLSHNRGPPKKIPKTERPPSSVPGNHEIHGYMPGRREFEIECENDAEQLIKDLEFLETDTQQDTALKMAMFGIYNAALDRRAERKQFVFERELTDFRKLQQLEKKRSKEEKEVYQRMRVFSKMQTKQDFEDLMAGLLNEMKLRDEIAQLQEYRRMGLTSRRDIEPFERDKRDRDVPRLTAARFSNRHRDETPLPRTPITKPPPTPTPTTLARKPAAPLDISHAEGLDLLTPTEQQLCTHLRLFPKSYLVIKETILKEYAKTGSLRRRQCRELIKIDVNKTSRIYDFFVEMGWIKQVKRGR